jgi:hypothetical protein
VSIGSYASYKYAANGSISIGANANREDNFGRGVIGQGNIAIGQNSFCYGEGGSNGPISIGRNTQIYGVAGSAVVIGADAKCFGFAGDSVVLGARTINPGQFAGGAANAFFINQVRYDNPANDDDPDRAKAEMNDRILWYKFSDDLTVKGHEIVHGPMPGEWSPSFVTAVDFANERVQTQSIRYKTFVIDHPKEPENKHLVHVCLEGPEAGVYYRGKGEVTNNDSVEISLPDYVPGWAHSFTTHITAIYDGKVKTYAVSEVDTNGKFNVYGENGTFNWTATGKRGDIEVEPLKTNTNVKGFGPYKWME